MRPSIDQILLHPFFHLRSKAVKVTKSSSGSLSKWFKSNLSNKNIKKATMKPTKRLSEAKFKRILSSKKRGQSSSIYSIPRNSNSRSGSIKACRKSLKSLQRKSKRTSSRSIINKSLTSSFSILHNFEQKPLSSSKIGQRSRLIQTEDIPACVYETKNGRISILKDGRLELELLRKKRIVTISKEGTKIVVKNLKDSSKNCYKIEDLPPKYNSVYKYAHQVLELIKSKIPKCKFENKYGKFLLMKNKPFPNFEAYFHAGLKLMHQVSSDKVVVKYQNSQREINLFNGDLEKVDQMTRNQVEMAMKYLNMCLKQE